MFKQRDASSSPRGRGPRRTIRVRKRGASPSFATKETFF
jgi:hypothetical protein